MFCLCLCSCSSTAPAAQRLIQQWHCASCTRFPSRIGPWEDLSQSSGTCLACETRPSKFPSQLPMFPPRFPIREGSRAARRRAHCRRFSLSCVSPFAYQSSPSLQRSAHAYLKSSPLHQHIPILPLGDSATAHCPQSLLPTCRPLMLISVCGLVGTRAALGSVGVIHPWAGLLFLLSFFFLPHRRGPRVGLGCLGCAERDIPRPHTSRPFASSPERLTAGPLGRLPTRELPRIDKESSRPLPRRRA